MFGPIHRLDVDRRLAVEFLDAFECERLDLFRGHRRLHAHIGGGAVDALAMQVKVRRDAIEPASAIENCRGQPHGV
ncbi:hypothetical protein D3C87_1674710 [compost metagenome]